MKNGMRVRYESNLSTIRLILNYFRQSTSRSANDLSTFNQTQFTISNERTMFRGVIRQVLRTYRTLNKVVVLIVSIRVILNSDVRRFFARRVIIRGELNNFTNGLRRRTHQNVNVRINVFTYSIIKLSIGSFRRRITHLYFTNGTSLITMDSMFLNGILTTTLRRLRFRRVLSNFRHRLQVSLRESTIHGLICRLRIFPLIYVRRNFTSNHYCFFFIRSSSTPITLRCYLCRGLLYLGIAIFFDLVTRAGVLWLLVNFTF